MSFVNTVDELKRLGKIRERNDELVKRNLDNVPDDIIIQTKKHTEL